MNELYELYDCMTRTFMWKEVTLSVFRFVPWFVHDVFKQSWLP